MSFEDVIINCVDCQRQLPFQYQFQNRMRCPACEKKFIALSKEQRIAANQEVARRFNQEGK
ncbi:hypothetical protein [Dictyobacter kobayashii]|uniref:hypothetical protein n=1 Tax=Dictyobacter kobayashii TaxID=2014872 RepID=UPI000F816A0E|nr:hypothetical protein [Dictyobacter kobayashii]